MVTAFGYLKNVELERDTKQKSLEIFSQIYKKFNEVYGEFPFLPNNLAEVEKEWGITLIRN